MDSVQDGQPVPPLLADFRKMRTQMQQQGLFKCKKGYYLLKLASNFGLLAAALAVFAMWRERPWAYVLSACLISLFWQQSGWLAHDFCHHQVFRSKRLNYFMGLLVGTVCLVSQPAYLSPASSECLLAFLSVFPIVFHPVLLQLETKHLLASMKAASWSCLTALHGNCRGSVQHGGKPSTTRTMQLPTSLTMTARPHWTQTLTLCHS